MNLFQSTPDLSYRYVSSATILLHLHYVHLTSNMSLCQREWKWLKETDVLSLVIKKLGKLMDFTYKSNTAREQKASSRVAWDNKQFISTIRREY